ncbi:MAG: outer membrane beta-barrel domain-containing protein, partial [Rhodoferax sp.]|nr:outer membrane beta-barrel domain-containing protein [Rhodoferax sp.]
MRRTLTALLLSTTALTSLAQTRPADEPPIVPEVERRELRLPRFPSRDFEVGAFVGTYATENFGASAVYGLRLGYHLTEDWFFEGTFGSTQVSDASF